MVSIPLARADTGVSRGALGALPPVEAFGAVGVLLKKLRRERWAPPPDLPIDLEFFAAEAGAFGVFGLLDDMT